MNGGTGGTGGLNFAYWCPHGHLVEPFSVQKRDVRGNVLCPRHKVVMSVYNGQEPSPRPTMELEYPNPDKPW